MKNTKTNLTFYKKIKLFLSFIAIIFILQVFNFPLFYFKLSIILILFLLNIYFILEDLDKKEEPALEAGISTARLIKQGFSLVGGFATYYSTAITIKTYREAKKKEQEEKIKAEKEEEKNLIEGTDNYILLHNEHVKTTALKINAINELRWLDSNLKDLKKLIQEDLNKTDIDSSIKARAKTIFQEAEQRKKNFYNENPEIKKEIDKLESEESIEKSNTTLTIDKNSESKKDHTDIKESFIFSNFLDKFESLDVFGKLAIALLLLKSTLVSAMISIVFIFYGDYLIKRFNLETRFPKLTEIINLRRKFNRYYLIWSLFIIISVILIEVLFALFILLF